MTRKLRQETLLLLPLLPLSGAGKAQISSFDGAHSSSGLIKSGAADLNLRVNVQPSVEKDEPGVCCRLSPSWVRASKTQL